MMEWHLITGEYPPQYGGVSDYTHQVALGLAEAGDEVHVWCPRMRSQESKNRDQKSEFRDPKSEGKLIVHREMGQIGPADLRRVGKLLDQFPAPRRLLVQWVPHGFGMRAMNLPFCLWLWQRARRGDEVQVMAHECYLPFKRWAIKQNIAALAQRLMTILLLRAARRVWMSIPAWERYFRPLAFSREITYEWLPVPSNIAIAKNFERAVDVRRKFGIDGEPILGHFGTYGHYDREMLEATLPLLLASCSSTKVILIGRNSDAMRDNLINLWPELAGKIHATGSLEVEQLSLHLSACDVMLQPYQGGVSARRTTMMANLAHGRAVVTTTGTQTEPIWSESNAVVLVSIGEVQRLVTETERLLQNDAERTRLSRAASDLYRQKFDIQHMIGALLRSDI